MVRKICITLSLVVAVVCGVCAQQVSPRIAGLEGNEEYMSLLREDARLQMREDSLTQSVNTVRLRFREDPANRQQHSKNILALEEQIFNVRNAKGRLVDRIGTIEQNWVIANLDSQPMAQPQTVPAQQSVEVTIPEADKVRNLIYNPYFARELSADDYAALRKAQRQEMLAVEYINRYFANYNDISRLVGLYAVAGTEVEASELLEKYKTMRGLNEVLADSLAATWNEIFDDKTYVYAYLLEKLGKEDILAREEQLLSDAARQLSAVRGNYTSDAVSDYFLRKAVAVDYEIQVASLLRLDAARDSLRGVSAQLKQVEYRLPRIEVSERSFIEYAPIAFSSASKYTYAKPIPECKVYAHGTVYRILLGTFASKRAASMFKGAYPLSYIVDDQKKWLYFAGGFATEEEVQAAQKQMKGRGFTRPEIVVWHDGHYLNLSQNPEQTGITYRVEILGVTTLPDAAKAAIETSAANHELSRVGQQMFVIGTFEDRTEANKVADAIRKADGALEIKVAEIAEYPN